jgi:6-phosphofructokinase 2
MPQSPQESIAVLALNPAVDISYEIPQLVADQKVRATQTRYHPGGNGINVTRALTELGIPTYCCSIIGGESGNLLLRLLGDTLGENHRYFRVAGETRLNATLLQKTPPGQYEVDSVGPHVDVELLAEISECLVERCRDGIAVLTGSTPPGVPDDIYLRLAERVKSQGGKAVVDAHGEVLERALIARPYLVRLNHYVLEMSARRRLDTLEAVALAARDIHNYGLEYVCISLGSEGAILVDAASSYHCSAPRVRIHSTVGCGDAMVAGMVTAIHRNATPQEMLRLGVICGSATASHPGTELFARSEIEQVEYDLEVQELGV